MHLDVPLHIHWARWSGWLKAPAASRYVLSVDFDDHVRLWVDGRMLLDRWEFGPAVGEAEVDLTDRHTPFAWTIVTPAARATAPTAGAVPTAKRWRSSRPWRYSTTRPRPSAPPPRGRRSSWIAGPGTSIRPKGAGSRSGQAGTCAQGATPGSDSAALAPAS